jgi:hypothetical protein
MDDEREGRISGWIHRHAELVWYALAIVFVIYGATALVNLSRGVVGPDHSNLISTFGGIIAGTAAAIIGWRTARDKKRADDDE